MSQGRGPPPGAGAGLTAGLVLDFGGAAWQPEERRLSPAVIKGDGASLAFH